MSKITYHRSMLQHSDEWYAIRIGMVTASTMKLLLTPTMAIAKNKDVKVFAYEIAAQRETGIVEETGSSWDMDRGTIEEDFARTKYSEKIAEVDECGFITREHDGIIIGMSPDGLVGSDGGIEIKSRKQKFQIQTIVNGEVPAEYMLQIQTSLFITGRKWWDFVQYSNGMPLFVKRVLPDLIMQSKIIEAVTKFEDDVWKARSDYKANSQDLFPCDRVDHLHGDEIESSGGK